jgi:hypothetical protein
MSLLVPWCSQKTKIKEQEVEQVWPILSKLHDICDLVVAALMFRILKQLLGQQEKQC